jgi:hypothetical protein
MISRHSSIRALLAVLSVMAILGAAAGCVSVPTSGHVEQAHKAGSVSTERNEIVAKPPPRDATPREIVDGFLLAMTRYQSNYKTARQYLTAQVRDSWRPGDHTTIYTNRRVKVSKTDVTMSMNCSGELDEDYDYTARSGRTKHDFKLRRTRDGQWRISHPPKGLLISEKTFSRTYDSYNVYFFDPQFKKLVPQPVYLRSESQTATALVQRLLDGPTDWLGPAVSSAAPAKTSLITNSVPTAHGLAKISLSETILDLSSRQRKKLAVQLAWTLKQVENSDIKGLQITANGDTFHIPGEKTRNGEPYVPNDIGQQYDPVGIHRDLMVGVSNGGVAAIRPSASHPKPEPIHGTLGRPKFGISSVALSADAKTVAAVTDGRTRLRTQAVSGGHATTALDDQTHLLRPDFTRGNALWTMSGAPAKQKISVIKGHHVQKVKAPWLAKAHVSAFRISPDASRIAVIVQHHGKQRLAMAAIARGAHITLGKLRTIGVVDNASAPIDRIADLGWISATRLMIIGASGKRGANEPYGVQIDGSQVERIGISHNWGARSLSAVPDSSGSFRAVVGGRQHQTWIYRSGDVWESLAKHFRQPAYAG